MRHLSPPILHRIISFLPQKEMCDAFISFNICSLYIKPFITQILYPNLKRTHRQYPMSNEDPGKDHDTEYIITPVHIAYFLSRIKTFDELEVVFIIISNHFESVWYTIYTRLQRYTISRSSARMDADDSYDNIDHYNSRYNKVFDNELLLNVIRIGNASKYSLRSFVYWCHMELLRRMDENNMNLSWEIFDETNKLFAKSSYYEQDTIKDLIKNIITKHFNSCPDELRDSVNIFL